MSTQSKISKLEKPFACPVCGNRFHSKRGMGYHRETEHDKSIRNYKVLRMINSILCIMEKKLIWTVAILSILSFTPGLTTSYLLAQVNSTNQTGIGNMTSSTLTPSGNLTNKSSALITNTT